MTFYEHKYLFYFLLTSFIALWFSNKIYWNWSVVVSSGFVVEYCSRLSEARDSCEVGVRVWAVLIIVYYFILTKNALLLYSHEWWSLNVPHIYCFSCDVSTTWCHSKQISQKASPVTYPWKFLSWADHISRLLLYHLLMFIYDLNIYTLE